jgi:[ribosomal protein S18]-alanine N-acetyltransferase
VTLRDASSLGSSGTVRAAVAADADAVVRLEETCLGADAWSRGLVEQGIGATLPTVTYLVAEVDGAVVGHAVASAAGDDAELQRIAVDPAYRRRGLAGELLAAVEEQAAAEGATRLLLEVREDNATAADFYQAQGFEEVGRRRGYYRDGAAAVVLGKKVGRRGGTASLGDS